MRRGLTKRGAPTAGRATRGRCRTRGAGAAAALALAAGAVLTLGGSPAIAATGTAVVAGSTGSRPAWAAAPAAGPAGLAGLRRAGRPEAVATPLSSASNLCWSQPAADPVGDAQALDLVSVTLQYDCATKQLLLTSHTVAPFATPAVHDYYGAFDTDANASTGCGGADLYADAAWVPAQNRMLAAIFTKSSCGAQPVFQRWIGASRSDPYQLTLSFDPTPNFPHLASFNWSALIEDDNGIWDIPGSTSLKHAAIPDFPPSGSTAFTQHATDQVGGAFTALIPGQFAGNAATDVLLYRAGAGADALATNDGTGHFTSTQLAINGSYTQIVPGDFNGDGHTDLLFYLAGSGQDYIWFNNGSGGFTSRPFTINGGYVIVPGDFNGDGYTDLLFYAPGPAQDYIWTFHNGGFTSRPFTINGSYRITPADLTGDGRTDLLFYGPGSAPDYIWAAQNAGTGVAFTSRPFPISGVYDRVIAGDFNGDGHDDLFFWSRGWGHDSLLRGSGSVPYVTGAPQTIINEFYDTILVGDFNHDGKSDMFLVQYGPGTDVMWFGA